MERDELEPFIGTYDWEQAFIQNSDQSAYAVSEVQRLRVHGVTVARPRKASTTTGWFMTV